MATKTFKIGLSATDKQNMAQDIYEQVEQLLFAEYDSSETYNTGDFVVYSDVLYRCKEDNVTGTWNSAKWEQATLQDLVDSVNSAVASVTGKANTADLLDGVLVPSQALSAKAINPVSSESGTFQTTPFILQGTGTANGTDSVDTSNVGKHVEKHGNSVVVIQMARPLTSDYWGFNNATGTFNNGVATFTATAQNGQLLSQQFNSIANHEYLLVISIKLTTGTTSVVIYNNVAGGTKSVATQSTTNEQLIFIETKATQSDISNIIVRDTRASDWDAIQVKNVALIDLTQWFNDDIPQDLLDHPENAGRYGLLGVAYNTGTLTNANGRYLECGGRNVWDEQWEVGGINNSGGDTTQTDRIRTKGYIKVIPNCYYYSYIGAGSIEIHFYDENKNHIDYGTYNNVAFITPSNCFFIRFRTSSGYGNTYLNNITISLYYTPEQGGEGYSEHYAYEEPKVYDTGTETLRSAGSVKDIKKPDGTIIRNVGVVDLGTLDYNHSVSGDRQIFDTQITNIRPSINNEDKINALCVLYNPTTYTATWVNMDMSYAQSSNSIRVAFVNNNYTDAATFKTAMSGVYLYYELATPTEEQGTPFAENIEINDYGTMGWKSNATDYVAIPQGCKIFYPADYVLLIDTLNGYVSGSVENLALKSDLSADKTELQGVDTQLQNAIGGTLRQCLCVKESLDFEDTDFVDLGNLNWGYNSTYQVFIASSISGYKGSGSNSTAAKMISTLYKNTSLNQLDYESFGIALSGNGDQLQVKNTSYTDATTFKAAMKGVLLAYEKA